MGGNVARFCGSYGFSLPETPMSNRTLWIIIGVIVIVVMLFGGLLPLPGQKDNVTPHTEPSPPAQSPR